MDDKNEMLCYQGLSGAILKTALDDYKSALEELQKNPINKKAYEMKVDCEDFLMGDGVKKYTDLNCALLMRKVRELVQWDNTKWLSEAIHKGCNYDEKVGTGLLVPTPAKLRTEIYEVKDGEVETLGKVIGYKVSVVIAKEELRVVQKEGLNLKGQPYKPKKERVQFDFREMTAEEFGKYYTNKVKASRIARGENGSAEV